MLFSMRLACRYRLMPVLLRSNLKQRGRLLPVFVKRMNLQIRS
jgi:hypothetical protein